MKEVLAVGLDGRVMSKATENKSTTNDQLLGALFEDYLKKQSKEDIEAVEKAIKIDDFSESMIKNGINVAFNLGNLVIYDTEERTLLILPPNPSEAQLQYFLNNFFLEEKRLFAFYFGDGLEEIYDLVDEERGKQIIVEKFQHLVRHNQEEIVRK